MELISTIGNRWAAAETGLSTMSENTVRKGHWPRDLPMTRTMAWNRVSGWLWPLDLNCVLIDSVSVCGFFICCWLFCNCTADDKTREVAVQTPVRDAGKVKKASTAAKASKKVNNGTVRSSVQNAAPLEPSSSASTLRTFGKPTSDTHVLVDDYADHSRPLVAKFLQTPQYLATVDTNGMRSNALICSLH